MITCRRISSTDNPVTLVDVKEYLNITGDTRDSEIEKMIDTAICRIEDYCDVSLRVNDIEFSQDSPKQNHRLPYIPVDDITEVIDLNGNSVNYRTTVMKQSIILDKPTAIVCRYKTSDGQYKDLIPAILAYVALLFDGVTDQDAFGIIRSEYLPSQGFV